MAWAMDYTLGLVGEKHVVRMGAMKQNIFKSLNEAKFQRFACCFDRAGSTLVNGRIGLMSI
jgi:hypothetical protein